MPEPHAHVEGITEYRWGNGLRAVLFPDPGQATFTLNATVFVGSRHEGHPQSWWAHLLDHLLFKGTDRHPDIPAALQRRGAQFNGTTWLDRTNYYETLPATPENLEFAIRLESDRLLESRLTADDLVVALISGGGFSSPNEWGARGFSKDRSFTYWTLTDSGGRSGVWPGFWPACGCVP
jgi:zinc protease